MVLEKRERKMVPERHLSRSQSPETCTIHDTAGEGIFIFNLKKGNKIKIITDSMNGFFLKIEIVLVNPDKDSCAISIETVTRCTDCSIKNVSKESIGVDTPVVVLSSFKPSAKIPVKGWIGPGCNLLLSGTMITHRVRSLLINNFLIFPAEKATLSC